MGNIDCTLTDCLTGIPPCWPAEGWAGVWVWVAPMPGRAAGPDGVGAGSEGGAWALFVFEVGLAAIEGATLGAAFVFGVGNWMCRVCAAWTAEACNEA